MHLEKRGRLLSRNYKVEKLGCNASLALKILLPAWWSCGRSTRPSKVTSSRLDTFSDSGRSVILCKSGGLRDLVPWNLQKSLPKKINNLTLFGAGIRIVLRLTIIKAKLQLQIKSTDQILINICHITITLLQPKSFSVKMSKTIWLTFYLAKAPIHK